MPGHHAAEIDAIDLDQQPKASGNKWVIKLYKFDLDISHAIGDQRTRLVKSFKKESEILTHVNLALKFLENAYAEGSFHPAFLAEEAMYRWSEYILASLLLEAFLPEVVASYGLLKVCRVIKVVTKLGIKEGVISPAFKELENYLRHPRPFPTIATVPRPLSSAPALPDKRETWEHMHLPGNTITYLIATSPKLEAVPPQPAPTFEVVMPGVTPIPTLPANQPQSYVQTHYDEQGRIVGHTTGIQFQLNPTSTLDVSFETREGIQHVQITHGFHSKKLDKPMSVSYGATMHEGGITHTGNASLQVSPDTTFRATAALGGGISLIGVGLSTANPAIIIPAVAAIATGGVAYGIYRGVKKLETNPPPGIEAIGRANIKQTKILTKAIRAYREGATPANKKALAQAIKTCQKLPLKSGQEILYAMEYNLNHGYGVALDSSGIALERYQTAQTVAQRRQQQAQQAQQHHEAQCKTYDAACIAGDPQAAAQVASESPTIAQHFNDPHTQLSIGISLLKEKGLDVANAWIKDRIQGKDLDGKLFTQYAEAQNALGFPEAARQTAETTLATAPGLSASNQETCHVLILNAVFQQPESAQTNADILKQTQALANLTKEQSLTAQGKTFLLHGKDVLWYEQIKAKTTNPDLAAMTQTLLSNPQLSPQETATCYGQLASDPGISKAASFQYYQEGLARDPIHPTLVIGTAAGHGERLHFPSAFAVCQTAKNQLMERIAQCQEKGEIDAVKRYQTDLDNIQKQENKMAVSQWQIAQFGVTAVSYGLQKGCDYVDAPQAKKGVRAGATLANAYISHRLQQVTPKPPASLQSLGNISGLLTLSSLAAEMVGGKEGQNFAQTTNAMNVGLGMTTSSVVLAQHLATAEVLNPGAIVSSTFGILIPAAAITKMLYLDSKRAAGQAPTHFPGIMLEGTCAVLNSRPVAVLSFGLASETAVTSLWTGAMHAMGYGGAAANSASVSCSGAVAAYIGAHAAAFAVGGAVIIVVAAGAYYNHQWYANRIHNISTQLKSGGIIQNRQALNATLSELLEYYPTDQKTLNLQQAIQKFDKIYDEHGSNMAEFADTFNHARHHLLVCLNQLVGRVDWYQNQFCQASIHTIQAHLLSEHTIYFPEKQAYLNALNLCQEKSDEIYCNLVEENNEFNTQVDETALSVEKSVLADEETLSHLVKENYASEDIHAVAKQSEVLHHAAQEMGDIKQAVNHLELDARLQHSQTAIKEQHHNAVQLVEKKYRDGIHQLQLETTTDVFSHLAQTSIKCFFDGQNTQPSEEHVLQEKFTPIPYAGLVKPHISFFRAPEPRVTADALFSTPSRTQPQLFKESSHVNFR